MNYHLYFLGTPKAVQSVRFGRLKNGTPIAFKKKEVVDWQTDIRIQARQQLAEQGLKEPLTGGIELNLGFYYQLPSGAPARIRKAVENGLRVWRIKRPDLVDNLCKGLCDALTGVAWVDDSQIAKVVSSKAYTRGAPGIVVVITQIKEECL